MSSTTSNLGLFKYDTTTDSNVAFSITKALNNNWDIIDAKFGQGGVNLLDFKWSDHLLNDMSWLRADTFSWQDGNTYSLAYNELLNEYNNSASVEETEGEITFKRTPKGYKIALATQETAILNKYNTDGIAWFYILDTTNKKFKLPIMKHKYWKNVSTLPVKGNGMTLGFQNDLGAYLQYGNNGLGVYNPILSPKSAAYSTSSGTTISNVAEQIGIGQSLGITTDSSKSGIVADVSNAIEETGLYLYFYVGGFTKSAESQTAGLKAELLNGKADVDTPSIQAPYIKDTYINGTSGYRIWSDGYCEQWGYYDCQGTTYNLKTINFLKLFIDTNYQVYVSLYNEDFTGGLGAYNGAIHNKTTSSFQTFFDGNVQRKMWKASGYLSQGEY